MTRGIWGRSSGLNCTTRTKPGKCPLSLSLHLSVLYYTSTTIHLISDARVVRVRGKRGSTLPFLAIQQQFGLLWWRTEGSRNTLKRIVQDRGFLNDQSPICSIIPKWNVLIFVNLLCTMYISILMTSKETKQNKRICM